MLRACGGKNAWMSVGIVLAAMACGEAALAKAAPKKPVRENATASNAAGMNGAFYLDRLPNGKSVTIPRPATTIVPLTSSVMLTATDIPQSLSIRAVTTSGSAFVASQPIRISIFDRNSDRVRYVDLKPGMPYVYSMKDLETITVVPQVGASGAEARNLALRVESDKPLEIAH